MTESGVTRGGGETSSRPLGSIRVGLYRDWGKTNIQTIGGGVMNTFFAALFR